MKKYFISTLAMLALIQGVYSQTDIQQMSAVDQIRLEIQSRKNEYVQTENSKDSYGYRYVYRKGDELKLVMVGQKDNRDPGKFIDKKVEWYFSDGHLVFCEQTWTDIITGKVIDHQTMYLNDEHLIAWFKTKNNPVDNSSSEFKDLDTQLIAYQAVLKKGAK